MVWSRTILDGILLCLIFNLTVAVTWIFIPCAFSNMLPKEIRLAAPPRKRKEVVILACVLYPLYLLIFAYMIVSSHLAGVTGFWHLFWTGYIEMFFINMGDLWGLDFWYRGAVKDKIMIPGTEGNKGVDENAGASRTSDSVAATGLSYGGFDCGRYQRMDILTEK